MPTKKGKRLVDVLDENYKDYNWIFDKFILLLKRIESLQSGQNHIKSDIHQNERRRQYDEWRKRNK